MSIVIIGISIKSLAESYSMALPFFVAIAINIALIWVNERKINENIKLREKLKIEESDFGDIK